MPVRAFIDSDKFTIFTIATTFFVLMPVRAFIDSDLKTIPHHTRLTQSVLMPVRAFIDSDDSSVQAIWQKVCDSLNAREGFY